MAGGGTGGSTGRSGPSDLGRSDPGSSDRPLRVAVVAPMRSELRPLVRRLRLRRADLAGTPAWAGTVERTGGEADREARSGAGTGREVVQVFAVLGGVGTGPAQVATHHLLAEGAPDHVVVVGICGSPHTEAEIGTLVVPEVVIDAATGREHRPHPLGPVEPAGRLHTSDELVRDLDRLADLHGAGVVGLDMETSAVAHACEEAGVRWSVFRAVSDRAGDDAVDEAVLRLAKPDGGPDLGAVARYVLRDPRRSRDLARLGADLRTATTAAADAAVAALRAP